MMQQTQSHSLDDAKKRIIARAELEVLIGETVALTRRGTRLTGLCPFHAEKSPSFYVFDDHYHCFGCHAHGDAISFVRQTRELSFIESLRYLARKFGVDAPELEESAKFQQRRNEQAALSQIMVASQDYFVTELHSPRGQQAMDYLRGRGFSDENIQNFGFGLTPEEHYGLVKHLRSLRFRDDDVMKVGMGAVSNKTGNMYDFFRERIMIPIRDATGRVIAFGGRTTSNDPAKYKNSMATPLFDKSSVLFGLDRARSAIKMSGRAILVEGYMDALCLWQEGFPEAVACMGTALNVRQLKQLLNHAKCTEVIILFDGDQAGQSATLESIDVALALPQLRVRAAKLEGGEDPDTYVRKVGAEALRRLLEGSLDLIDAVIEERLSKASPAAIPTLLNETFVPWLVRVQDPIKRSFLLNKVAARSGVAQDVIARQVRSLQFGPPPLSSTLRKIPDSAAAEQSAPLMMPSRPLSPIEESFICHLFYARPGELDMALAVDFLQRELHLEPLWDSFCRLLVAKLSEQQVPSESADEMMAAFTPEEARVLSRVVESNIVPFECHDRKARVAKLMLEHSRQTIQRSIAQMKQQLQMAGARAPETVPEMLQQIMTLTRRLGEIQAGLQR